jgi:tRNA/tmRNA/rRNA uracil-C5-methylase (TrmA/RlmC/RlmD family)
MAALLTTVSANGVGTGASHSGPATVFVRGTFDGATVVIQVSDDDTTYVKADNVSAIKPSRLSAPGCCDIFGRGTYYIRCVVENVGSSTSISAVSTQ